MGLGANAPPFAPERDDWLRGGSSLETLRDLYDLNVHGSICSRAHSTSLQMETIYSFVEEDREIINQLNTKSKEAF